MRQFNVTTKDSLTPETLNKLKQRVMNSKQVQSVYGWKQKMTFNSLLFTEIRHNFTNYDVLIKGVKLSNEEYVNITNQVSDILQIVLPLEKSNIINWTNIRNSKVNNRTYR